MGDKEYIGVIVDELLTVLESMKEENNLYSDDVAIVFGIKLLKYLAYLCMLEGVDLSLEHDYKTILE